jgi:tetratricopeptide (TPR) repeat protein
MRSIRLFLGLLLAAVAAHAGALPVWQTDWKTAFRMAGEEHRLVFVDYSSGRCGPCHDVERLTFQSPDIMSHLSDFVLLRVDVERSRIPSAHRPADLPAYMVYDPAERERFRIVGEGAGAFLTAANLEEIHRAAPALLRAAELASASRELEAELLVAGTYSRLRMATRAREAYAEARKLAGRQGDAAAAQAADVQAAFTFALEGKAPQAVERLQALTRKAATHDDQAIVWLYLGHAYGVMKDTRSALESYERARSLAAPGSRTAAEAGAAIERLHS